MSNRLGSFDEVIFSYHPDPEEKDKASFRFVRLDQNKNPELNYYGTFDPRKIIFYHSSEKDYPLKNYNSKNQIAQLLIFYDVFINTCQGGFVNII
jgi:hypothetical protein